MAYCADADLEEVFPELSSLFTRKVLAEDWTQASGQTNTYQMEGLGYVEMVFDDGVQLTSQTSIANVESNPGSFHDDTDADVLYIHAIDSDDLTATTIPTIQIGLDQDAHITKAINAAQEEMDAYLSKIMITPLLPRMQQIHSSNDYEAPVRYACAYLACRNIVRQRSPGNELAMEFERLAIGGETDDGYVKGYIQKILDGDMNLQDQILAREVGSVGNVKPNSSNSGTGRIFILPFSKYTGSEFQIWRVQIDTLGDPGTATYKLSKDTGSNWDETLQETFDADSDDRRINIGSGIYIVFLGTFAEGDYWDLELFPLSDEVTNPKITSIGLSR